MFGLVLASPPLSTQSAKVPQKAGIFREAFKRILLYISIFFNLSTISTSYFNGMM